MARVIDLHAHVVLEEAFGTAGPYGPALVEVDGVEEFHVGEYVMRPCRYRGSLFMDVDVRLLAMDAAGIDLQLLSPNPLTFLGGVEPALAAAHATASNDAMAALVATHPDRLLGAASVPMQDPAAACGELQRAVGELGLVAAYAATDYGAPLDDPRFDDVYSCLVELDVPLLVHAATNDGSRATNDARLGRFGLDLVLGYAYEETLAAAALVLGGVLDRHPRLDVCISHGAGAFVFLLDRFRAMASFRSRGRDDGAAIVDGLRRLWFDAHGSGGAVRELLIDTVGADRLVWGTNFGGWDSPPCADEFAASLTPNAERFLRLEATGS